MTWKKKEHIETVKEWKKRWLLKLILWFLLCQGKVKESKCLMNRNIMRLWINSMMKKTNYGKSLKSMPRKSNSKLLILSIIHQMAKEVYLIFLEINKHLEKILETKWKILSRISILKKKNWKTYGINNPKWDWKWKD